jgi:uncharacterized protein YdeI (YjbR/CyaY-like superfamily)
MRKRSAARRAKRLPKAVQDTFDNAAKLQESTRKPERSIDKIEDTSQFGLWQNEAMRKRPVKAPDLVKTCQDLEKAIHTL